MERNKHNIKLKENLEKGRKNVRGKIREVEGMWRDIQKVGEGRKYSLEVREDVHTRNLNVLKKWCGNLWLNSLEYYVTEAGN